MYFLFSRTIVYVSAVDQSWQLRVRVVIVHCLIFIAGAEVRVLTHIGETPLHCAADMPSEDPFLPGFAGDHLNVMKSLLQIGVDVNARCNDGRTAFAIGRLLFHLLDVNDVEPEFVTVG